MDGNITTARRLARLAAIAVLAASPAIAAAPEALPAPAADAFEQYFLPFEALPDAPDPASQPASDAVDLDQVEAEAEADAQFLGTGRASFYGTKFHGRPTASGQRFDMHKLTAAHRTLPFGSKLRVTNERNGKSVIVTVNDRGPFHHNRVLDLSRAAAKEVGMVNAGSANVRLELLKG